MPLMPLLLETIKIEDGHIYNLDYHQKRCSWSRKQLYGSTDTLTLSTHIIPPPKGLYRCRILYAKHIQSIEYIPYVPKKITSLKIIKSNIDYRYKYADRHALESLLSQAEGCEDILIEKKGYITDTSIANIAFYDKEKWITPKVPLLQGTMRQKLIDEGFLHPRNIRTSELDTFTQVALMNAMIGFKSINNITIYDTQGKQYDY
jgi:4-amino-4-deoxychorismate lyase